MELANLVGRRGKRKVLAKIGFGESGRPWKEEELTRRTLLSRAAARSEGVRAPRRRNAAGRNRSTTRRIHLEVRKGKSRKTQRGGADAQETPKPALAIEHPGSTELTESTTRHGQGCIFHWADALDRIDEWFEMYVAPNKELKLLLEEEEVKPGEQEHGRVARDGNESKASSIEPETVPPAQDSSGNVRTGSNIFCRRDCLSILKASAVILENCNNRGSYGSVEVSLECKRMIYVRLPLALICGYACGC